MQGSLTGMHIPFVKTDTGPLLGGFHQAKTPITISDWLARTAKKTKKNTAGVPLTHNIPIMPTQTGMYTYTGHIDTHGHTQADT